ncbi:antibiotic biosynthesis monooxygenase [Cryobacterium sp. PH31-AA6]|uniref:antibiotic biosynthesis monooxygenase n=1 Tax=Cryobacterium sp. PH31-AA6 TaxID=3046205 RepID=UPI0024BAFCDE|nr:antibiotic biosynthesis monooxygenase [Cryobacterium sp. PH31-AA6]MDJ0325145.1 antibiotic biosynthesis monooxygenase [Cryobacterium sp. PH31-AA6]
MSSVPPGNAAGAPQARPTSSVTVSVTRRVEPTRIQEATHWAQQGMDLASSFPGFLGSGWVRANADSLSWHMLYRFATAELLDAWEGSPERAHWLIDGHDLILDALVEKRTGIEGWFEAPQTDDVDAPFQPPRWKQAVSIGLGFLPSNVAFTLLAVWLIPGWGSVPLFPKILITTLVMAPAMTFLVMPWVTRALRPWLYRGPKPRGG